MTESDLDLENMRLQFEAAPYPRIPPEASPKGDQNALFVHNFMTPYYLRNQQVISTEGKTILDVGCGTGFMALVLAEANPGAKIVGIDLSETSVELARQRLQYHNFKDAQFFALSIDDLPSLGMEFDYINCDETLYLLPDIAQGLERMKSVLKSDGIIRANLHSSLQRVNCYRAQEMCRMMGLMETSPDELEVNLVRETMNALKESVSLRATLWHPDLDQDGIRMNYLLQGDKGFTIPDMFAALRAADLEFISMVKWRQWELLDLFKDPSDLPAFWAMSLPDAAPEDLLHLYELLHPVHRLLDFWCGHPGQAHPYTPAMEWPEADWQTVTVHLHPQLRTERVKTDLITCIRAQKPFNLSQYLSVVNTVDQVLESRLSSCLLPLWDGPQPLSALAERWHAVKPLDPITLEPISATTAFNQVKQLVLSLEVFLYVLLEHSIDVGV